MFFATLILGAVCMVAWAYLLVAHGGFWKVWQLGSRVPPAPLNEDTIAAVIPARDEVNVIAATVQSLLAQSCADSIRIFVVDDHSSDDTAESARRAAVRSGRSEALEVIPAKPFLRAGLGSSGLCIRESIRR